MTLPRTTLERMWIRVMCAGLDDFGRYRRIMGAREGTVMGTMAQRVRESVAEAARIAVAHEPHLRMLAKESARRQGGGGRARKDRQ